MDGPAGIRLAVVSFHRQRKPRTMTLTPTAGDAAGALRALITDAVLVATPEYNHSIPGALKNALDWVSRPLLESPVRNKPAAVISSSTGMFGGVWAAAETRKVLGALGARVLDEAVAVPKAHERLATGSDDALAGELRVVLSALEHEVGLRAGSELESAAA